MYRLGYRMVPVTVAERADGVEVVVGFNPKELARVFGLPPKEYKVSSKDDLELFDQVVAAAVRATRQVPDNQLGTKSPDRERPIREFLYHIFGNPEISLDAFATGKMSHEPYERYTEVSKKFQTSKVIADFGEDVRVRLKEWARSTKESDFDRVIDTYMTGTITVAHLLDKSRAHTGQHLRQLYVFLRSIGIEPEEPITEKDFERLGVPSFIY